MKRIYLDSAATTPVNKHIITQLQRDLKNIYGNPSSLHYEGKIASEKVEKAREQVAKLLGCDTDEIFFTSGASESNSWVAKCAPYKLVATNDSHTSLEKYKFKYQKEIYERKTQYGELMKKNIMISYPLINNEMGYEHLFYRNYPFLHVDLTQALGKVEINLHKNPYILFASASGHKIGGLKGCGILYIKKSLQCHMKALIEGHQENNFRGGTENVLGIISFGYAAEETLKNFDKNFNKIADLIIYTIMNMPSTGGLKYFANANIINITFKYLNAQTAVQLFDRYGICISAGSACNSGIDEPSDTLLEFYTKEQALNTIRVSLSPTTTKREIRKFTKVLKKIVDIYDEE